MSDDKIPKYDHKEIEQKWQERWEKGGTYKTTESGDKPKCYVLDMFPYPSGAGLHVGHPRGYVGTDVYSRFKRMSGFNVLHPMGFDAFGLPAENHALKNKLHPKDSTDANIKRYKEQLQMIGFDYDWSREVNTTDPKYYKWTQWIFVKLFEKGLAYESHEPINWCPSCKTGLANEDLDGVKCERCGSIIEKKPLRQWVLKITDYADRLLEDLDELDWPEYIKDIQRNWIGKKEGMQITHKVEGSDLTIDTFTAYPAWSFADTYLVLAPEHPAVAQLVSGTDAEADVMAFLEDMQGKTGIERTQDEKRGVFTGQYVVDPFRPDQTMPVWVANFALMDFGTGAIRCSAHDPRDREFAAKYDIKLRSVADDEEGNPVDAHANVGTLGDSGPFTGKEVSNIAAEVCDWIESEGIGKRVTTYRLKDWVFSRQRYWGEPIPIVHCGDKAKPVPLSDLPVELPNVKDYEPTGTGESPLAAMTDWLHVESACGEHNHGHRESNTMPQWAGSSWYYLRYMDPDNDNELVSKEREKYWGQVDLYVGGVEHAARHLIYARFWHKFLYDLGIVSHKEPFKKLQKIGLIGGPDGRKMSKRWGNVINPDDVIDKFGADSFRLYEMFLGPFSDGLPWQDDGILGPRRLIEKVWRLKQKVSESETSKTSSLDKTIKKVGEDITELKFNTAVSAIMILASELDAEEQISKSDYEALLQLLAPFAPHVSEELWHELGHGESIHLCTWPNYDESALSGEVVEIAVQINGKVRDSIFVSKDTDEQKVKEMALASNGAVKWMEGKEPSKVIYVPGRLVSIVVS